jgi:predicted AlkP superfamily phosphohydrolase/phosphomutase
MIVSDHGSGPNYPPHNYYLNVNHLLEHLGYLAYKDRSCENILVEMALQGVLSIPAPISVNIYRLAQALMAEAQKHQKLNGKPFSTGAIAAWLQQKAGKNGKAISIQSQYLQALAKSLKPGGVGTDIDWESTSAWNVEDLRKNKQGIFINLKGREKSGVVLPNEYKTFKKQLIQVFKKLVTDKGRPLFNTVEAGQEEIYESPGRIALPDIKVEVNRGALSDNLIFKGKNDPDPIPLTNVLWIYKEGSGDHIREGVFLLAGAHAASFRRIDISLYDIAPTILWALGFPVGADMPGRIISEAFSDSMAGRKKMLIESWTGITKSETITDIVTTDEKQLEQLRSLGYVR